LISLSLSCLISSATTTQKDTDTSKRWTTSTLFFRLILSAYVSTVSLQAPWVHSERPLRPFIRPRLDSSKGAVDAESSEYCVECPCPSPRIQTQDFSEEQIRRSKDATAAALACSISFVFYSHSQQHIILWSRSQCWRCIWVWWPRALAWKNFAALRGRLLHTRILGPTAVHSNIWVSVYTSQWTTISHSVSYYTWVSMSSQRNGDASFQIITENARMCENADVFIRRRAQFRVKSHDM